MVTVPVTIGKLRVLGPYDFPLTVTAGSAITALAVDQAFDEWSFDVVGDKQMFVTHLVGSVA